MTEVELTRAVECGALGKEVFDHASHLHVAWTYLCESRSVEEAAVKMRRTLRSFTARAGVPQKYHETITLFWLYLLAGLHAKATASGRRLEELLCAHPQLMEKNFPLDFYSPNRLFSASARESWLEPDLKPLSFDVVEACSSGPPRDSSHWSLSR